MILITQLPNEGLIAFAGPVNSFYEITTDRFQRIFDEEWIKEYLKTSSRLDWVNIYLADVNGHVKPAGNNLITDIKGIDKTNSLLSNEIFIQNFPNPFNNSTIIHFTIPSEITGIDVELNIYNINGEKIKQLLNKEL